MNSFEPAPSAGQPGPVLVFPPLRPKRTRWEIWRDRLLLFVFVLFSLEIGIILTVAPWTAFWANNSLLAGLPQLQDFLMHNFVRGLISGLGLTDIWLAVIEAVQYRDNAE